MPMYAAQAMQHIPPPIPGTLARGGARMRTPEESEFELRRRFAVRGRHADPHVRVAALLVSISTNNGYEGRDPHAVPDVLTSGFVADLLGLDLAVLEGVLVDLERQGLIAADPSSGLVIADPGALQQLAQGQN